VGHSPVSKRPAFATSRSERDHSTPHARYSNKGVCIRGLLTQRRVLIFYSDDHTVGVEGGSLSDMFLEP
jgi:hypothetical protein